MKPRSRSLALSWCGAAPLRSAPFGFTATPVMSCAPSRLPRGQLGTARRARRPKPVRSRLRRHRKDHGQARCARRVRRAPPPTRPVSHGGVVPLARHSFSRRVCPASRPPPPGGGSLNSRRPTAKQPNAASHAVQAAGVGMHRKGQRTQAPARQGPSRLRGAAKAAALTRSPPVQLDHRDGPRRRADQSWQPLRRRQT